MLYYTILFPYVTVTVTARYLIHSQSIHRYYMTAKVMTAFNTEVM